MKQFIFEYDHKCSHQQNFESWYSENSAERRYYKERIYPVQEAKLVFNKMYGKYNHRKQTLQPLS